MFLFKNGFFLVYSTIAILSFRAPKRRSRNGPSLCFVYGIFCSRVFGPCPSAAKKRAISGFRWPSKGLPRPPDVRLPIKSAAPTPVADLGPKWTFHGPILAFPGPILLSFPAAPRPKLVAPRRSCLSSRKHSTFSPSRFKAAAEVPRHNSLTERQELPSPLRAWLFHVASTVTQHRAATA